MRVALLTSANGWRGSGASYAKIAHGLLERGHTAHLVTAVPRLTTRLLAEGLPVTQLPGRDTGPREVWGLLRALRRAGAQAIVADTPRDVRLSAYATLVHRARILYRYNLNYRRPRNHLMDRIYLGRVAACAYQSRYIRDDALAHIPWMARIPGYHIPNGYDTARYAPRPEAGRAFRAKHGIPSDASVVLTSAKLTRYKGHEVAMEALSALRRQGREVIYLVCGDGVKEAELRQLARELDLPALFTGLLATDDLIAALSGADVVVHPSLREIFPNAVGEAMACARPVIAADAGGSGELVGRGGQAGLLVPPGEPDLLAAAVEGLLDDPARRERIGQAARRRIETQFPLGRMVDGYESALMEMVGAGG